MKMTAWQIFWQVFCLTNLADDPSVEGDIKIFYCFRVLDAHGVTTPTSENAY
jgi:hypothetical protein